jgi:hypothetical protein
MAWSIAGNFVGTGRKTTGATAVVTLTTGYPAGDVVVVWAGTTNVTTGGGAQTGIDTSGLTITDSKTNTWIRAKAFEDAGSSASNKSLAAIYYTHVTNALVSGDTVTMALTAAASGQVKKAITVRGFTGATGTTVTVDASTGIVASGGTTSGNLSIADLASNEYLFLSCYVNNNNTVNTICSGDTTNGWALGSGQNGSSGGAAGSNIVEAYNYQIATATGVTCNPSFTTLTHVAHVIVALRAASAAGPVLAPPGHPIGIGIVAPNAERSSLSPIFESQITG